MSIVVMRRDFIENAESPRHLSRLVRTCINGNSPDIGRQRTARAVKRARVLFTRLYNFVYEFGKRRVFDAGERHLAPPQIFRAKRLRNQFAALRRRIGENRKSDNLFALHWAVTVARSLVMLRGRFVGTGGRQVLKPDLRLNPEGVLACREAAAPSSCEHTTVHRSAAQLSLIHRLQRPTATPRFPAPTRL